MQDYTQETMEKKRITIGTFAIIAVVSITSIAATLLGLAQMA